MVYCGKVGNTLIACYPSKCTKQCRYRVAVLATYDSDRAIALACGIDYCTTRCTARCAFPDGTLCDDEIERLLHNGLIIEDVLGVDLSDTSDSARKAPGLAPFSSGQHPL